MFLDYFFELMLKIILKNKKYIYYIDIFLNKIYFQNKLNHIYKYTLLNFKLSIGARGIFSGAWAHFFLCIDTSIQR